MNFESTIRDYCRSIGWRIHDSNSSRAVLKFSMNSGRTQTCYIIRYDSTLEFSVPSGLAFDSDYSIPGELSTNLLKRNAQNKIGFWCIERIGGRQVFSYMHNAELQLLNHDYFRRVVEALIKECDNLESAFLDSMR